MEIKTCIHLLKYNFEHLVSCFDEQKRLQNLNTFLLQERAIDILDGAIAELLIDEELDMDNLRWLQDAVITYLRYFPENLTNSSEPLLNAEIDQLFTNLIRLNEELVKV